MICSECYIGNQPNRKRCTSEYKQTIQTVNENKKLKGKLDLKIRPKQGFFKPLLDISADYLDPFTLRPLVFLMWDENCSGTGTYLMSHDEGICK